MDEIGRILMTQVNILFIVLIVCAIIKMKYGFEEGFSKGLYRIVVTIVSIIVILEIIKGIRGALLHQTLVIISAVISLLLILVIYKIINLPLTSLKLMAKTPGLHALDKVLGSALGMIECLLLFWIASGEIKCSSIIAPAWTEVTFFISRRRQAYRPFLR